VYFGESFKFVEFKKGDSKLGNNFLVDFMYRVREIGK
jgi:hypothetical protein